MTPVCEVHGRNCAYPNPIHYPDPDALCPWCHLPFSLITAPDRELRASGVGDDGPWQTWHYLSGRGQLPLEHLAGHVEQDRCDAANARKRAAKDAA